MPQPIKCSQPIKTGIIAVFVTAVTVLSGEGQSGDWPWWRGEDYDGKAAGGQDIPLRFSPEQNVVWKAEVPGRGHASPVVVGDRIFLATADGDAETQSVIAFDRGTGDRLWMREISRGGFPRVHKNNTHASSTLAVVGDVVCGVFYNHDALQVFGLGTDGEVRWEKRLVPFRQKQYKFGFGASPLVAEGKLVIVGDQEKEAFLVALDPTDGEEEWRARRPDQQNFSSPILAETGGRSQILISGSGMIASYSPTDGSLLWSAPVTPPVTCGTVVWDGETVFASGGYPNKKTVAVRSDGSGEVVWDNLRKCYEQSMLCHDGYLYGIDDGGVAYCWKASDGDEMWRERLGGPISASPVLVGDRIYAANEKGEWFVFSSDPGGFRLLAENRLGDDAFPTPTICGGRIYARVGHRDDDGARQEILYCIGKK